MTEEVRPGCLGDFELLLGGLLGDGLGDGIWLALGLTFEIGFRVGGGFLHVHLHVKGVAGGFGDGEAVVEGDATGHGTEADEDTPHLVDGHAAVAGAGCEGGGWFEGFLEAEGDEEHDEGGAELAETLHGEDGAHHGTAPFGGGELGGDDAGEGVVTADTDALGWEVR